MKLSTVSTAIAGALVLSSAAHADLVTVLCTGTGAGRNVSVTHGTTTANVFAGQLRLTLTNSTGQNVNGLWTSFCTELSQFIQVNGAAQTYQVLPVSDLPIPGAGMGSTRANAVARMFASAAGTQYGTNADLAAAFQIAVWEITMDFDGTASSIDIGAGTFKGNSLTTAIQSNLTALFAAASNLSGAQSTVLGIGNSTFQDQLLDVSTFIPAPGAVALLGLAGLVGARRRK